MILIACTIISVWLAILVLWINSRLARVERHIFPQKRRTWPPLSTLNSVPTVPGAENPFVSPEKKYGVSSESIRQRERQQDHCSHKRVHTEGSLGWFCNACGAPMSDEWYIDG